MSFLLGHIRYLGGFGLASLVATLADLFLFSVLVHHTPVPLPFSAALAALLGALIHFSVCRYWVFGKQKRHLLESASRYALVSGVVMLCHSTTTTLLALLIDPHLAWAISKAAAFLFITYPASRYLVFGTTTRSERAVSRPLLSSARSLSTLKTASRTE